MKLAILSLLALASPAHAECMSYGLEAKVVAPSTALPVDGGIVVLAEPLAGGNLEKGDPALVPGWTWKAGGKLVVTSLAPGLAVIRAATSGELVDNKGVSKLSVKTSKDQRRLLDAPKPLEIVHAKRISRRGGEDVTVGFAAAPPATAVAIVLLDDAGPRSWHRIEGASTVLTAYSQAGCIALPNGTRPTKAGDLVKVAFVDDAGRMSPLSKAFKVQAKPSLPSP